MQTEGPCVAILDAAEVEAALGEFAALLKVCVEAGASVEFILPLGTDEALDYWRNKVLPAVIDGGRRVFVLRDGGRIVGTVQLGIDTPANQPHRADVMKLLVHPDARRRGVARRLMRALEAEAQRLGRSLLTLDTRTGDPAERLYAGIGFLTAGAIPDFFIDVTGTRLESTTLMYKRLDATA
jgi:ribosomal protein S18 acetylase RimI-like enzyme